MTFNLGESVAAFALTSTRKYRLSVFWMVVAFYRVCVVRAFVAALVARNNYSEGVELWNSVII